MQRAFSPFQEAEDPRYGTWKGEDKTDVTIPEVEGFVTDFVYATRGREVASIYGVWAALFLISSMVQRDAWFTSPQGDPWLDRELLNLYVLFIGPAGCGKSSAITIVQKILAKVMYEMRENEDGFLKRKEAIMISNMSTPEGFLSALYQHTRGEEGQRRQIVVVDKDGQNRTIKSVANGIGLISEFGSLLGKANYQAGMSTILLDVYDCPSVYRWNTVKRGHVLIPEVYYNMLGATTADSLTSNVNSSIIEDGFMSRTVMAYVPGFPRKRDFRFQTDCSMADLAKRLLWIAKTQVGAYQLSKDAKEYYSQWYQVFMDKMEKHPEKAGYMIRNRGLALRIAVLLKMGDYKPGKTVYLEHLKAAFHIIEETYKQVADLINYFANSRIGAAKKAILSVVLEARSGTTRRQLANRISRHDADTVDLAIKDLWLEGKIIIVNTKGDSVYGTEPKGFPAERYARNIPKHQDEDFEPIFEADVPEYDQEVVLGGDLSSEDSEDNEEEPVGDIPSPERVWG